MVEEQQPDMPQGIARPARLIPLRWPRSGKLAGYYDPDASALVYVDRTGREVDRVSLSLHRSAPATKP